MFETKFKTDPARVDPGRSQRKLKEEAAAKFSELIAKIFPSERVLPVDKLSQNLKKDMVTTLFAIAKGRTTCSAEAGHLPVVRFGMTGTRQPICSRTEMLMQHVASAASTPRRSPKQAYHWLKSASVDAAKAYKGKHGDKSLLVATVGPNDLFYLPAGWAYFEKVGGNDFIGVRHVHLGLPDMATLTSINKYLIAQQSPNPSLQAAVDCLAMNE